MENNDLLLFSEVIYRIHACQTARDLGQTFFHQINLLIPFRYASYLTVSQEEDGSYTYTVPFCQPKSLAAAEKAWAANPNKSNTAWLSSGTESMVLRDSELMTGNRRLDTPTYQETFQKYNIYDQLQMNVVRDGRTVGRLTFYRTRSDGPFTDVDAFRLRALSKHINLAFHRCFEQQFSPQSGNLLAMASDYGLTRREEEVLRCIFSGMDNGAICDKLSISRNTLYKHNNSIFQKCGVASRWELLQMDR